jgi:hypothetical protein
MQQRDLDRAVAKATGETVTTVRRIGFVLATRPRRARPRRTVPLRACTARPAA